jgi:hypothetical protein
MNRFYGEVGYAGVAVEDPNRAGVFKEPITERLYFGDYTRKARQLGDGSKVNVDITASATISILADETILANIAFIRYVKWLNVRWSVTSVTVQAPRLNLDLGGVYNGPTP